MRRPPRYASISDRAKASGVSTELALRGIAVNGLLARLAMTGNHAWMVKGAQALVARQMTIRATNDVDLRFSDEAIIGAIGEFRRALAQPFADGLTFRESRAPTPLAPTNTGGSPGQRLSIEALLDGSPLPRFHVDIVAGGPTRGEPSLVPFGPPIAHPDFPPIWLPAYPVVDHIADKLCALAGTHGPAKAPSSRSKDLYDLCVIRREPRIGSGELGEAIEMQWLARSLAGAPALVVPSAMREPYERLATESPDSLAPLGFGDAVAVVHAFVEPVLDRSSPAANWNGATLAWE